MNQIFATGAAVALAVILLGLGRKPKASFTSQFSGKPQLSQNSLVQSLDRNFEQKLDFSDEKLEFSSPVSPKEKFLLRKELKKLILSGPEERLIAIEIAARWDDLSVVPILKLGLRDMDSRVVLKAAQAISKYKSHPQKLSKKEVVNHPLNVFLMR